MKGKVYKIIHNQSNVIYIGSTFQDLKYRWSSHKSIFKTWSEKGETKRGISIYRYFEKYGVCNFKMVLIKEYEVCDRYHLQVYEQLWINKLRPCNEISPFSLPMKKMRRILDAREHRKKYPERVLAGSKSYREKNKEEIEAKKKQKIVCECGTYSTNGHLARHQRTPKHKEQLNLKYFSFLPFFPNQAKKS
jgi:hypothetical protein